MNYETVPRDLNAGVITRRDILPKMPGNRGVVFLVYF